MSNASGPSTIPCDLAAIGHLGERRRLDRRRHGRVHVFGGGQHGHLRGGDAECAVQVDRVARDVGLVREPRSDVHRRVGERDELRVGGEREDEDVAHAALRAQARVAGGDRQHVVVGVQAALHQRLHCAIARQQGGAMRGLAGVVAGVDDLEAIGLQVVTMHQRGHRRLRPDQYRPDVAGVGRFVGRVEGGLRQRVDHRRASGLEAGRAFTQRVEE